LKEQELLNGNVGQEVGDDRAGAGFRRTSEKDDPILQQQIAQGHLSLARILSVSLNLGYKRQRVVRIEHGLFLSSRGRHGSKIKWVAPPDWQKLSPPRAAER